MFETEYLLYKRSQSMLGLCKFIHKIIEFIVELEQKVFIVSDNNSTQNEHLSDARLSNCYGIFSIK